MDIFLWAFLPPPPSPLLVHSAHVRYSSVLEALDEVVIEYVLCNHKEIYGLKRNVTRRLATCGVNYTY